MKMIVLGGSPKGEISVTMQYVHYLELKYPEIIFQKRFPAHDIRRLEKNEEAFEQLIEDIRQADAILWAFPLYIFCVCSQYLRFLELVEERGAIEAFAGKPAASLSTSIHFFDHIAHYYIKAVCEDWKLNFIAMHSPAMDDLVKAEGRQALERFFSFFLHLAGQKRPVCRQFPPVPSQKPSYRSLSAPVNIHSMEACKITVIADSTEGSLGNMIERFASCFSDGVEIVDLNRIKMLSGCMGCLHCGPKNMCRYDKTDEVRRIYEEKIHPADVLVIAGTIRGRWVSSLLKAFIDRGFFHTHQPFLTGKQVALFLDGSLTSNPVLYAGLSDYIACQGGSLIDTICDETEDCSFIDGCIDTLAEKIDTAQEYSYRKSQTFPAIAGMNLFRDEVYMHLRMVFLGDHRFYHRNKIYKTLPHKRPLALLGYRLIGGIASLPPVQRKMVRNMQTFMLTPYKPVLAMAAREARRGQKGSGPEAADERCTKRKGP